MIRSITFSCDEKSGDRETLRWLSQNCGNCKPLIAALKYSVSAFTVSQTNYTTEACTFTLHATSDGAANTIRRNIPKFEESLKRAYEDQVVLTLEAVTVKH